MRRTGWNLQFFVTFAIIMFAVILLNITHLIEVLTSFDRLVLFFVGSIYMAASWVSLSACSEKRYKEFLLTAFNPVFYTLIMAVMVFLGLAFFLFGTVGCLLSVSEPQYYQEFVTAEALRQIAINFAIQGVLGQGAGLSIICRYKLVGDSDESEFWIFPWFEYKTEKGYVHVP